jgi:rhodanese-related sulfurtransferase
MKKTRSFFSVAMIAVLLVALVSIYGCSAAVSTQTLAAQPSSETPVVTLTTETPVVQPTSETQVTQLTTLALDTQPTTTTQVVKSTTTTTPIVPSTTTTQVVKSTTTTTQVILPTSTTTTSNVTDQQVPATVANLLAEIRSKAEQPSPGVYYIDAVTAKSLVDNTKVTIVDARYLVDYDKLHLAGAISLPVSSVWQGFIDPVTVIPDKEAIIIAYCAPGCPAGLELAGELAARGYHNLFVLLGGYLYWQQAGYPMVIKS